MDRRQTNVVDIFKVGAVIISLVILFFYILLPIIKSSNKKTFIQQINKCIRQVETKYFADNIDKDLTSGKICIDVKELINTDNGNYTGVVILNYNESINNYEDVHIYISNNKYVYNSFLPYNGVEKNDILDSKKSRVLYKNCGLYNTGKI